MRTIVFSILALPLVAAAEAPKPAAELYSRGLQQAKRVANMENTKDLPSRGYWLGSRVVKKSKAISYQAPKAPPPKAKN